MDVIEGNENIQAFFQKELDSEWTKLERTHKRARRKMLFSLLLVMNSWFLKDNDVNDDIGKKLLVFHVLLQTLNVLLERGWNQINPLKPEEVQKYVDIILNDFLIIGELKSRLLESIAFNEKRIEIQENQKAHEIQFHSQSVFVDWRDNYCLDGDWIEYYYRMSTQGSKIAKHVRREFRETYGVTQELIYSFEIALSKTIREELRNHKARGFPFVFFLREHLLSIMRNEVPRYAQIDSIVAESFLKELEYVPGNNWSLSPFVKSEYDRRFWYIPILPAFYPLKTFTGTWLNHITDVVRASSALGMMGNDWGNHFERFVRDRLQTCHPNLDVAAGRTRISPSDFPDIKESLEGIRKTDIEIDVIAQSSDKVYLISCKAHDQFVGPRLLSNPHYLQFDDFLSKIEQDITVAAEISDYASCLRQSTAFLEWSGFHNKEIIPLLITSDSRPLSFESVRCWVAEDRTIPDVQIIQARGLDKLQFD